MHSPSNILQFSPQSDVGSGCSTFLMRLAGGSRGQMHSPSNILQFSPQSDVLSGYSTLLIRLASGSQPLESTLSLQISMVMAERLVRSPSRRVESVVFGIGSLLRREESVVFGIGLAFAIRRGRHMPAPKDSMDPVKYIVET